MASFICGLPSEAPANGSELFRGMSSIYRHSPDLGFSQIVLTLTLPCRSWPGKLDVVSFVYLRVGPTHAMNPADTGFSHQTSTGGVIAGLSVLENMIKEAEEEASLPEKLI